MSNTPTFKLSIQGQEHREFLVLGFDVEETISQPFSVTIDAVCENYQEWLLADPEIDSLLSAEPRLPTATRRAMLTQLVERRSHA